MKDIIDALKALSKWYTMHALLIVGALTWLSTTLPKDVPQWVTAIVTSLLIVAGFGARAVGAKRRQKREMAQDQART